MTPTQFKAAIAKLELSQEAAGELMGSSKRQGQRWASGASKVPVLVAAVLRLILKGRITIEDVEDCK